MTYKKILKCTICGEDMESRTARRIRCADCKSSYLKRYKKNWLRDPNKLAQARATVKKYQENNREARAIRQKEYAKKHPERVRAHNLSQGIRIKTSCEICGGTNLLYKHHWNYNKPLLVSTLCVTCHTIQHIKKFNESKYAGEIACGI